MASSACALLRQCAPAAVVMAATPRRCQLRVARAAFSMLAPRQICTAAELHKMRLLPVLRLPKWQLRAGYASTTNSSSAAADDATEPASSDAHVEDTDVLVVGAGPAGLATAIRLKQLAARESREVRVMVIEKGAEVGSHILSGNILEPRSLEELFPNWKELGAPLFTPATKDKVYFLTRDYAIPVPHPPEMNNKGNYIISLSMLARWLNQQAESLGVEVYPGFAGARPLLSPDGSWLTGVATGDFGIARDGTRTAQYEPGMHIRAKVTVLAEGCHGSLTKKLTKQFNLRKRADGSDIVQTYGLGLKEVWELDPSRHDPGLVVHTLGWPTDASTYQGAFIHHWHDSADPESARKLMSIGLVVGLDYPNPYLRPYMEFQRFKHHPQVRKYLEGGKCVEYGARTITEGGWQSIPNLAFPGGVLVGCAAGFINVPKIKGTHTAMKSGILAADTIFKALSGKVESGDSVAPDGQLHISSYDHALRSSWVGDELRRVRNVRPAFPKFGLYLGLMNAGFETLIARGRSPWTISHKHADHEAFLPAAECSPIEYPKPDGVISFDLTENLARSGTQHNAAQPAHLKPQNEAIHVERNLRVFDGPEARFCPAGVYEFVETEKPYQLPDGTVTNKKLQINAQNCVHCKTCDIKDPSQSIDWTTPEGGGGPNYTVT